MFGQGMNVAHYGGRFVWQLSNAGDLLVSWKRTLGVDARDVERKMIEMFREMNGGHRPFANRIS